jgi:glycerol-3-phosphate O-acyltransferase
MFTWRPQQVSRRRFSRRAGFSRDGKLRPPKFGLLSYMVAGFDPLGPRDVVFIPVAVNYDRVLEDRMLTSVANAEPGKKPVFGFNAAVFARHFFRHVWMALRGEWHRFGYTCVSFGVPVSLRNYVEARKIDFRVLTAEPRRIEIERLGNELMEAVGRVVPALPVSLVSTAVLEAGDQPLTLFEIKGRVSTLIDDLERLGSYVHIPRADRDYAISVGLRMLTLRHLVIEDRRQLPRQPERARAVALLRERDRPSVQGQGTADGVNTSPHVSGRHRPRRRAIQYSRDSSDRTAGPRRTGYPAFAGYDGASLQKLEV